MVTLVAGATSPPGHELCRQLHAQGCQVRALTRSESSAAALREQGYEAVLADLGEPASLSAAVEGADAVYVSTQATPELPEQEANLARAAAQAGARHLAKLSVVGASAQAPFTIGRLHHEAEQAVRDCGVGWTIVRANGFMQNTLRWKGQISSGTLHLPVLDARWSIVDARDVASTAASALREPERHQGQTYTVSGPEAASSREQVAILSELLERPLEAQEVSIEQAQEAMIRGGYSPGRAQRLGELLRYYGEGHAADVSRDCERVTGSPPRNYRQFAEDHLEAFVA